MRGQLYQLTPATGLSAGKVRVYLIRSARFTKSRNAMPNGNGFSLGPWSNLPIESWHLKIREVYLRVGGGRAIANIEVRVSK
jgi:hypothetical protein